MQNIIFVLLGINIAGLIALAVVVLDLRKKINIIFGVGKKVEGEFEKDLIRRLARTEAKLEEYERRLIPVEAISKTSVQKVGFLRFNPFKDTGGDNSFVLVFLDHENNGVILTSYYTREGVKVYSKDIQRGTSKYSLSEEEKRVLEETVSKN